jgi:nicotinamide mononucleotide adenylyltransferase
MSSSDIDRAIDEARARVRMLELLRDSHAAHAALRAAMDAADDAAIDAAAERVRVVIEQIGELAHERMLATSRPHGSPS